MISRILKFLSCFLIFCLIVFALYTFLKPSVRFSNSSMFIGILENFDSKISTPSQKTENPRVRIVFLKENGNWHAIKNNFYTEKQLSESTKYYPNKVTWSVIENKKYLGKINTIQYTPYYFSDVGIHAISENLSKKFQLPSQNKLQFFNTSMKMDHKPLVLISSPNDSRSEYDDPETWIKSKLTKEEASLITKKLRKKTFWYDFSTLKKHTYDDQDVRVIDCYRSNKNELIVSTLIKNPSTLMGDTYLADVPYWFHLSHNSVQFLEKGMMGPIEIADIDRDGKTEWIFLYSDPDDDDQNTNGYILFYDDFKKSARFTWNNH